ncbi:FAD-dependent oxidoreductase [Bradyrhizobium sp. BR 1433]|uniref:FAD-dependent oxidoreductase n=1 Tax=Bradyrhizobium sp. BR 1433 TaxID=3447967 RepID=UPI003EE57C07
MFGKYPEINASADLLVVGAGPAGIAAALDGARSGAKVTLVDENPISAALMGMDVPLFYGQRMTTAVQQKERMVEQLLKSNPGIEAAFEAGVEVLLGTYVWGAFVNGPGVQSLPGRIAGLADETRAWLLRFDRIVIATGARDLVLSFRGAELPGVMGANAMNALLSRYDAFDGHRLVVLGSGALALTTALAARDRGLDIAAIVEVRDEPQGPPELVAELTRRGVQILTSDVIVEARGGVAGVTEAILVDLDNGAERVIACDTVCLAIGLVPNIELVDVLGCKLVASSQRGGHVPVLDENGQASLPGAYVVGDAAGVDDGGDAYRIDWMQALEKTGGGDVKICLCEEVTRAELAGVKPPRYLGPRPQKIENRSLATMLGDGPLNHDQMKRLTRVSMGACQARRCREQVALKLALVAGVTPGEIPLAGYRAPVRPLPLNVLATIDESSEMREHWERWLGVPGKL